MTTRPATMTSAWAASQRMRDRVPDRRGSSRPAVSSPRRLPTAWTVYPVAMMAM